eukprot:g1306.t1
MGFVCSSSPKTYDAIIIGAGIIGSSIALELSRAGFKTLNIEKEKHCGEGSTIYSSGIVRTFYSLEDATKLAWEGYHYFTNWKDHIGNSVSPTELINFRECGGFLTSSPLSKSFIDRVVPLSAKLQIPHEFISRSEAEDKFGFDLTAFGPPKRVDDEEFGTPSCAATFGIEGGFFFPKTGYVSDPNLACRNIVAAAESTGLASFMYESQCVEITKNKGRVKGITVASGEELFSSVVINAAGPASSSITKLAFKDAGVENDMKLTTKPMRVEVAQLDHPFSSDDCSEMKVMLCDFDVGIYSRPEISNQIIVGGIEAECDQNRGEFESKCENFTEAWTNYSYRLGLRYPTLQIPNHSYRGIVSYYDVTEDFMPIYDRTALDGFYLAIGTSGNQFKNCASVGALMAGLVEYVEGGNDQDNEPLQFKLKQTKEEVNTKSWSRRRVLNSTTGGVIS